jgi:ribosylpyrimidine nucleosidase
VKIILDCDPGHDDATAILMAAAHPDIELKAVTVVAGNQTLGKTALNALNVCAASGRCKNIPVAAGMSRPLVRQQVTAGDIHGASGLDGPSFGPPDIEMDPRHAVDLMIETVMAGDGDITVVPIGPLTNVAMALRREPRIAEKIERIVLMGGAYQTGNVTPSAEFNIYADPEAAHIVFTCGRPIVMMGLDVTRRALATPDVVARVRSLGNPQAVLFAEMMEFFAGTQKKIYGWEGPPLHDPTTIAWLIDPGCVKTKPMRVEIELRGELTYGRTCCRDRPGGAVSGEKSSLGRQEDVNALVGVDIDAARFWDIVYETFAMYGTR